MHAIQVFHAYEGSKHVKSIIFTHIWIWICKSKTQSWDEVCLIQIELLRNLTGSFVRH